MYALLKQGSSNNRIYSIH